MDRALSGPTTPGQSAPGSNGYERILNVPETSSIRVVSTSDCLV